MAKWYRMMHIQGLELSAMTAVWLLPIVSPIVAAASGAIVADVLVDTQKALATVIASIVLWGIGLPMAMIAARADACLPSTRHHRHFVTPGKPRTLCGKYVAC